MGRYAPWLIFALGAAAIWIPERPPMTDLPQHAGQVGLLRDLILGRSPWKADVWINLFTPYLLGYAVTLPLALVMPVAAALKCVLTAAYATFGILGMAIRRELAASARLDVYFFVSFLGFSYTWGLFTFLVAAPVGLAFIWLSIRYASEASVRRGAALALLGIALLFSHGLVFLYAAAIGGMIIWANNPRIERAALRALPLLPSVVVAGLFLAVSHQRGLGPVNPPDTGIDMGAAGLRLLQVVTDSFGVPGRGSSQIPYLCFVILAATPVLGGLKLNTRSRSSLIPAGVTIAALLLAPDVVWGTAFIYARLTLFLPSAYAWLFRERSEGRPAHAWRVELAVLAGAVLAVAPHLFEAARFSAESRGFDAVMAKTVPGQRALGLVIDPVPSGGPNAAVYAFFPSWYQADRHGFVDYSFAAASQEVVRFRRPPSGIYDDDRFAAAPENFDWRRDDAGRYRYFFVRSARPVPAGLFAGAPCPPSLVAVSGAWRLYERCQVRGGASAIRPRPPH